MINPSTTKASAPGRSRPFQMLTFGALAGLGLVAWWFLIASQQAMQSMQGDGVMAELMWAMMRPSHATPYLLATALMWVMMMVAMMVPAVVPMVLVFRRMDREPSSSYRPLLFAFGYLTSWWLFAGVAAVIQWLLHRADWLVGSLLKGTPILIGVLLIVAGVYQLTPFKEACLAHCQSPIGFFMQHWRDGRVGAWKMGFSHGLFCIGCCWMLMALMFVGGAMSVATMALLSAFILAERLLPPGPWLSKLPGMVLVAWGGWVMWAL